MPESQRQPVGVTMRPEFLRYVHDRLLAGEVVESPLGDVPVFSDPGLRTNFRVFYDWQEFVDAIRLRVISGDTVRFTRSPAGLRGIDRDGNPLERDEPTRE